jgi:hypothetical protein
MPLLSCMTIVWAKPRNPHFEMRCNSYLVSPSLRLVYIRVLLLICIFGTGIARGELINSEVSNLGTARCSGAVPCAENGQLGDIHTLGVQFGGVDGFPMMPDTAANVIPAEPCPTDPFESDDGPRQVQNQVIGVPIADRVFHIMASPYISR